MKPFGLSAFDEVVRSYNYLMQINISSYHKKSKSGTVHGEIRDQAESQIDSILSFKNFLIHLKQYVDEFIDRKVEESNPNWVPLLSCLQDIHEARVIRIRDLVDKENMFDPVSCNDPYPDSPEERIFYLDNITCFFVVQIGLKLINYGVDLSFISYPFYELYHAGKSQDLDLQFEQIFKKSIDARRCVKMLNHFQLLETGIFQKKVPIVAAFYHSIQSLLLPEFAKTTLFRDIMVSKFGVKEHSRENYSTISKTRIDWEEKFTSYLQNLQSPETYT